MMVSSMLLCRAPRLPTALPACWLTPTPQDALLMHFWGRSFLVCSPPFLCSHTFPCTQSEMMTEQG